jgi:hypothetical protein
MGLDLSHEAWHGAYSAFRRFRIGLAKAAGIPLGMMAEYYDPVAMTAMVEQTPAALGSPGGMLRSWFEADAAPYLPISWDVLADDPLIVLLDHSDCDGEIDAADCGALADRIEELIPLLPKADDPGHIGNWEAKARQFVAGLRLAASRGEDIEFR